MSSGIFPVLFIGGFVAFIVGIVLWAVVKQRGNKRRLAEGLRALGATGGTTIDELYFERAGRRFPLEYYQGSKNSPARLTIRTEAPSACPWSAQKTGAAGRWLDNLGLGSRIATGDPEFDADTHIDCEDPAFAASCFADAKRRAALTAVLRCGCARVELEDGKLSAVWTPFAYRSDQDLSFATACLDPLAELASGMPAGSTRSSGFTLTKKHFDGITAVGFVLVFLILGIGVGLSRDLYGRPMDRLGLLVDSLKVSLAIGAAIIALVVAALNGKSWLARVAPQLALIVLGLSAEAGYFAYAHLNAAWDSSAPVRHEARVVRKRTTRSKNSNNYYLWIESWRRPGREELDVDRRFYEAAGACVAITTGAGRFGREWIVDQKPDCDRR